MITKLDILSSRGGFLSLPLADVVSGYIVENIEGTDPVKATLVSTSFAQQDGAHFQSSRRETRNLKLRVSLEPDWVVDTVRSLRNRLYNTLMPKTAVDLTFLMDDGLEAKISGRVETCEAPMFVQKPAVDISILCFDPDFIDPDPILVNGVSTAGTTPILINYDGTVETGVLFKLLVDRSISEFTIYHQASDGTLRSMEFAAPLLADDVLTISTVSGSKFATRTRGGTDSSVLFGVSPQANWFEFTPGSNTFRVYAEGDPIPYTILYSNRYGGL